MATNGHTKASFLSYGLPVVIPKHIFELLEDSWKTAKLVWYKANSSLIFLFFTLLLFFHLKEASWFTLPCKLSFLQFSLMTFIHLCKCQTLTTQNCWKIHSLAIKNTLKMFCLLILEDITCFYATCTRIRNSALTIIQW